MVDAQAHLEYEVPYADTDMMGVVYYANYLVYFERARTRLLEVLGYPYREMEADGYALPVLQAQVDYKTPATYGDRLELYSRTGWIKNARIQVQCEVRRAGVLLAAGFTIHACLDLTTRRPVRLPARLLACCKATEEEGG